LSAHNLDIIYILSNPDMPGLVKIGKTRVGRGRQRVEELFTTGVPVPFNVEYAAYVTDAHVAEKGVHSALTPYATHAKREHFRVTVETARAALTPYDCGDATPELLADKANLDTASLDKGQRQPESGRLSNMDFFAMGLTVGDALLEKDSGRWAYIEDRHTVYFEGDHGQSLNGIYKKLHGKRKPGTWYTSGGTRVRWLFYNVQHGDKRPPWQDSP
jgi:hypothetical protein